MPAHMLEGVHEDGMRGRVVASGGARAALAHRLAMHSVLCVESSLARLAGRLHLVELLDIVSQPHMVPMLRASYWHGHDIIDGLLVFLQ